MFRVLNEHGERLSSRRICAFYVRFYIGCALECASQMALLCGKYLHIHLSLARNMAPPLDNRKASTFWRALFAFTRNNLFALIKFVSINKYFTSTNKKRQPPSPENESNCSFTSLFRHATLSCTTPRAGMGGMTLGNFRAQIIIIVMIMNCIAINTHTLTACLVAIYQMQNANRTSFHANKFSRTLFYAHIFRNETGPGGCGRARNPCETGAARIAFPWCFVLLHTRVYEHAEHNSKKGQTMASVRSKWKNHFSSGDNKLKALSFGVGVEVLHFSTPTACFSRQSWQLWCIEWLLCVFIT